MSMGEPKCGSCGSDLMAGMFHHCKPAWDEENQKLRVVVDTLKKELEEARASDEESLKLYRAARDRAEAANLQVQAMNAALAKIHDLAGQVNGSDFINAQMGAIQDWCHTATGPCPEKRLSDPEKCPKCPHPHDWKLEKSHDIQTCKACGADYDTMNEELRSRES